MTLRCCLALLVTLAVPVAAAGASPVLVTDVSAASPSERLLAVSIQGLANRQPDGPRVFLLGGPQDRDWLEYCLRLSGRPAEAATLDQLLASLRPELKGQILYDPGQAFALNVATTAAGVYDAVIAPQDLGLPTVLDLRGRWQSASQAYAWAISELLPKCDRGAAALLSADAVAVRDFAIQRRMFAFDAPASPQDRSFEAVLEKLAPGTAIYGNPAPALAPALSQASHFVVPAAQVGNLSFLSRVGDSGRFHQYRGYPDPTAPRYLALIFDCSDLDFAVSGMPALWERWSRGTVPLGWALPAALAEAAPPVLHRYYADAYRSGLEGFLLGPSGAGQMDVTAARAPFSFLRATAKAQEALDSHALLFARAAGSDPTAEISRLATETPTRGVFVVGGPDFAPLLLGGVPVVATPQVRTVAEAITYLDRIPLERRFAALCLDPWTLTPADAAHIAGHVARRFAPVLPEQLIDMMRFPEAPAQAGPAAAAVTSVDYPDPADPDLPVPVKASIAAPGGLSSASLAYRTASSPLGFYENMRREGDGLRAELPPLRCGGEVTLSIHAVDAAGRVSWSPAWTIQVPRADADGDGLSDAEESLLLTNPAAADTDGDGLWDSLDATPLRPDRVLANYLGPVYPLSDSPYLVEAGESTVDRDGRFLRPGQSCVYWLPLGRAPAGAPAVVGVRAAGPAALAISADGKEFAAQFSGELSEGWYSPALAGPYPGGVFLRASCPAEASGALAIRAVGVFSPPGAPSITAASWYPTHPGPEQPIGISASVFSPKGVAEAALTYRINGGGEITVPMQQTVGQRYQASIPALESRDQVEWWISARDEGGDTSASLRFALTVGATGRETVSLLGTRELAGDWQDGDDWEGAARVAWVTGARDSARVDLTGGTYTVWVLAGGRGRGVSVYVGNQRVGAVDPKAPDGWQQAGRVRLGKGRHQVHVVCESAQGAPDETAARYAGVVLSADPGYRPPADQVVDIYNSVVLLSPRAGDTLTGRVELRATGAGNVTGLAFSLDGQVLRQVSGPPFVLSLSTQRLPNGPHRLRAEGFDRAGATGLSVEVPITVAN